MLGDKIKYVCEVLLREKTIVEIANELGTSDNTIRNLYKKESVDSKYLLKLAEMAGIDISYFFIEEHPSFIVRESQMNYVGNVKGHSTQNITTGEKQCYEKLEMALREVTALRETVETQKKLIRFLETSK